MLAYKLLPILADGQFYSGTELGEHLNVSRAAVWKGMQNLEALGVGFDSVRGKGYRLHEPIVLLDGESVIANLAPDMKQRIVGVDTHFSIDSTNSELLRQFGRGENELADDRVSVCLSETQTSGRGRRGRDWTSPFGCNLYFSLARQFRNGISGLEGMSLVTGLAVAGVLADLGLPQIAVKWPNDILLGKEKIAGILLEMNSGAMGEYRIVTGVGINVNPQVSDMSGITQPWTSLGRHLNRIPDRNLLSARLTESIIRAVDDFLEHGFSCFRDEWDRLDVARNHQVNLRLSDDSVVSGQAMGVNNEGGLILKTSEGERVFNGGEISLRLSDRQASGS
jgi:BirA family biotin operon repressor/biotin-[acetyl-CoA-carboxylase] ligase